MERHKDKVSNGGGIHWHSWPCNLLESRILQNTKSSSSSPEEEETQLEPGAVGAQRERNNSVDSLKSTSLPLNREVKRRRRAKQVPQPTKLKLSLILRAAFHDTSAAAVPFLVSRAMLYFPGCLFSFFFSGLNQASLVRGRYELVKA